MWNGLKSHRNTSLIIILYQSLWGLCVDLHSHIGCCLLELGMGFLMFPDIHIREFLSMPFNGLKNKNVSCMDFLLKYSAFDLKVGHCNVLPIINLIKPSVSYCCILTVSGTLFLFCK